MKRAEKITLSLIWSKKEWTKDREYKHIEIILIFRYASSVCVSDNLKCEISSVKNNKSRSSKRKNIFMRGGFYSLLPVFNKFLLKTKIAKIPCEPLMLKVVFCACLCLYDDDKKFNLQNENTHKRNRIINDIIESNGLIIKYSR